AALSHWLARSARSRDPGGSLATPQALVAQWIRASDYGSEGWAFESPRARYKPTAAAQGEPQHSSGEWRDPGAMAVRGHWGRTPVVLHRRQPPDCLAH